MEIAEIKVTYSNNNKERIKIVTSKDCYSVLLESWDKDIIELQEEFKVLLLNRNCQVLGIYHLSKGGTATTIVDVKLIFSVALKCNASTIVVAHNHPSGNLKPSESDNTITEKMKDASKILDVFLLDHLVVTKDGYYSYSDNNQL